jgi:altronate hydrolase
MPETEIHFVEPAPSGVVPLPELAVHLHLQDNVAIAKVPLSAGTILVLEVEGRPAVHVTVRQFIPNGHKFALQDIHPGQPVRRFGQIIGVATHDILPGEHVHTHNLGLGQLAREYAFSVDVQPVVAVPEVERRKFLGYKRADGRVGTRNYIAVISTVNCSAHTCLEIAHHFTPDRLAAYPNVDGVVALTYRAICSMEVGGATYSLLQRTLAGVARHPNVGACIMVGLGCETNQAADLVKNYDLGEVGTGSPTLLSIQDLGGIRLTVEAGIAAVERLLPTVNAIERTPQPVSELRLALQCGGSDAWSGVTANPVVGLVSDELVQQGGTVVLAETTEIYGAEHLLTHRAISPEVGRKLIELVRWWEEHTRRLGITIDNNPSYGNKVGGLTTIFEKALGAVAKSGHSPLTGVYAYAEPVTAQGLTFMDSPGYDPVSVTGQVAGGCNLVLFTTGRGSVFGFKPAPSIKVASNSTLYERMRDDMDFNAGRVLEGVATETAAAELLDLVIDVASGQPSKSEAQGVGEAEFSPWDLGEAL